MIDGWVKIYTSSDFFKSELVRQFLVDNSIEAVLLDKKGYPYNIGEVYVYVQPAHAAEASDLIAANNL